MSSVVVLLLPLTVGTESGNASRSLTDRFNGPGMEKLQETSSGLAGVVARNKQVRFCETVLLLTENKIVLKNRIGEIILEVCLSFDSFSTGKNI